MPHSNGHLRATDACCTGGGTDVAPRRSSNAAGEPGQRDHAREHALLLSAAPLSVAWAAHAHARLSDGEEAYRDAWARRPVAELLYELLEEAADLGAWMVLADQALDHAGLSQLDVARTRAALLLAAAAGAKAHQALAGALHAIGGTP